MHRSLRNTTLRRSSLPPTPACIQSAHLNEHLTPISPTTCRPLFPRGLRNTGHPKNDRSSCINSPCTGWSTFLVDPPSSVDLSGCRSSPHLVLRRLPRRTPFSLQQLQLPKQLPHVVAEPALPLAQHTHLEGFNLNKGLINPAPGRDLTCLRPLRHLMNSPFLFEGFLSPKQYPAIVSGYLGLPTGPRRLSWSTSRQTPYSLQWILKPKFTVSTDRFPRGSYDLGSMYHHPCYLFRDEWLPTLHSFGLRQ